jgi:2-polyprenyl-3-methyl-5-hydroxy-6-metoxy-1,4-benzoquinol methylase
MENEWLEYYGKMAENKVLEIISTGRHAFHSSLIPFIVEDILLKLSPKPNEILLDIGCGPGILMRQLAENVASVIGVDHPSTIERAMASSLPANCSFIGGCWPNVKLSGKVDCILAYSVIQYTGGRDQATSFVDACVEAVNVGGRILIGDVPNPDKLKRFLNSPKYAEISAQYKTSVELDSKENTQSQDIKRELEAKISQKNNFIDDAFILSLMERLRKKGLDVFILPQDDRLPMSQSREDLLILRRS